MSESSTPEEDLHNVQNAVPTASTSVSSIASGPALAKILHYQKPKPKQMMVTPSTDAACMASCKSTTLSMSFDHPPPMSEEDRLKTFEKWRNPLVSPETLACNGFYYLGYESDVRCAFCKLELRCVEGDDPVKAHRQWAPQCPFLQNQAAVDKESLVNVTAKDPGRDECGPYTATALADGLPGPAHPIYASEAARLRSFKHWPRCMRQTPEDLAEAGFFYTGTGDRTKCFYCNGGINDWEPDDIPWKEHARLLHRCPYVHLVKGREYVQEVITEAGAIPAEVDPSVSTTKNNTNVGPNVDDEKHIEKIEDSNLCRICFAEERNVCFVPCGHVVCCAKCALATNKCPMCRKVFHNAVRLYFS